MKKAIAYLTLAAGLAVSGGAQVVAVEASAVDAAFETLKTYDWGADQNVLEPIEQAIVASHGDAAARLALEERLMAVLVGDASRSAKDFACRKLRVVGTARSVPVLANLLADEGMSHIARFALESIPDDTAAEALRATLPQPRGKFLGLFGKRGFTESKLNETLMVGVIGSLGARGDAKSVPILSGLLHNQNPQVAVAAAQSLGLIGTSAAGKALGAYVPKAPESLRLAVADACLACAEKLLREGRKADATALYTLLRSDDQPKRIQVAATKGILAVKTAP